ncbi:hypothetical protein [Chlorogloeopsis fritschii]|uniref:hypothetical protein n=1 Tax=Chlorogloeopsis fritschii TaxID=1124 RepID=UPI0023F26E74|nr:hypothetical protein [Chlorogloeopsis fritschii]
MLHPLPETGNEKTRKQDRERENEKTRQGTRNQLLLKFREAEPLNAFIPCLWQGTRKREKYTRYQVQPGNKILEPLALH